MRNVGTVDRMVRLVVGAVMLIIAFLVLDAASAEVGGIVLAAIGAIFVLTSAIGYCPLYSPFHFSTKK